MPEPYRGDSAGIARSTGQHLVSDLLKIPGHPVEKIRNLTWALHDYYLHSWPDAVFHDFRSQGVFLVSARRAGSVPQWVRIISLTRETRVVAPGLPGNMKVVSERTISLEVKKLGSYLVDILCRDGAAIDFSIRPVAAEPNAVNI